MNIIFQLSFKGRYNRWRVGPWCGGQRCQHPGENSFWHPGMITRKNAVFYTVSVICHLPILSFLSFVICRSYHMFSIICLLYHSFQLRFALSFLDVGSVAYSRACVLPSCHWKFEKLVVLNEQVTRGHNIIADGWAGASNPHPHLGPHSTYKHK